MAEGAPAPDKWREFGYIRDSGPRVTEYEAVSCYVQPSIRFDGSLTYSGFPDGRGTWIEESTALRHTDWFAFRDPAQMWNRPYIARQNEQEKAVEQLTRYHVETGTLGRMDPVWAADTLGRLYLPWAHFEYSIFRACSYSHREALSDTVAVVFAFNGFDKMRHAENIIFYQQDLAQAGLPLEGVSPKDVWMSSPELQGARRVAERLLACRDWGEIAIAANLMVDALLGTLVCDHILMPGSARAADFATPVLLAEAGRDRRRNRDWAEAFARFVLDDPEHGGANRAVVNEWVQAWSPEIVEAMRVLSPLAAAAGRSGDDAVESVLGEWEVSLGKLGIEAGVRP